MLDIKLLREKSKEVEQNLARRQNPQILKDFSLLLKFDLKHRQLIKEADDLRSKRNKLTDEIKEAKAKGRNADKLLNEAKQIPAALKDIDAEKNQVKEKFELLHYSVPNLLDESVPFGKSDADNVEVRSWGKPLKKKDLIHHGLLAAELGVADFERAAKISGAGFYFLKGSLALMEQALIQYSLGKLIKKGFVFVSPPLLINREAYAGVTDLGDFENVMYKADNEDLYLIATSEHPLTAMHSNEGIEEKNLPLKYCGLSACFRKEVGKRNIDERGLFRVHQFNKVEQIVFSRPEDSNVFLEEMVSNAEGLLKDLEIPYRVVNVCTGDMGTVAAKKYDVEGWSPREEKYIELMSCSNCASYQAVRSKIRLIKPNGEKEYVHTLNATMAAIPRILRILLEQNQTPEKTVLIPEPLQPYMNGLKEIKKEKIV
ncbi:MAG: serine--tRNA ligase [Candidatus Diapherotrites archaeon]